MDYKKNVMSMINRTTSKWVNDFNGENKEYLFLVQKNGKSKSVPEIKIEKINLHNFTSTNQQKLAFN